MFIENCERRGQPHHAMSVATPIHFADGFERNLNMPAVAFPKNAISSQFSHDVYEIPEREFQELLHAPPIDRERYLQLCCGSQDFARQMLDEFEQTSGDRIEDFRAALHSRDRAGLASKAHALKGLAGYLAADTLAHTCSELESAAPHADWNQIHGLIDQLTHELNRVRAFIVRLRTMLPTSHNESMLATGQANW
jgi:HPt (histidine-containing phosphotransfer) domain-containing protein